jgi:GntR family transcriptional regulator
MAKTPQKNIVPLYGSIASTIKSKIATGHYELGGKLSSEENFAKEYGVARITIRKAFSQLEQEGWITRQHGKGTFISKRTPILLHNDLHSFQSMVRMVAASPIKPLGIQNLKVNQTRIVKDIREFFNLGNSEEIARIQRVILKDNRPFNLLENFMPVELANHLSIEEIQKKIGIIRVLSEKIDIQIGKGEMHIEAMVADQDISDILGCQVMEPFICARIFLWFSSGEPFEIINNYLRADSYKYKFELSTDDLDLSSIKYP